MSNARFSADGFGEKFVSLQRIQHGVNIMSGGEDTVRHNRVFYPKIVTSDSFDVLITLNSRASYEDFLVWLWEYSRVISDPDRGATPMRVEVPSRRFDRMGFIRTGMRFGDKVGQTVYQLNLSFEGVSDPIALRSHRVSRYIEAKKPVGFFHSPSDRMIKAQQSAEEVLYGMTPEQLAARRLLGSWSIFTEGDD